MNTDYRQAKHIGIVACSAEGASLSYATIARAAAKLMGEYNHPQVTLNSIPMAAYMPAFYKKDMKAVADVLLASAEVVARAGADFIICPDNSCHLAWSFVEPRSPLPWMHIARNVCDVAVKRGNKKLGILGTRFTMTQGLYEEAAAGHGLEVLVPSEADRKTIDDTIWRELVRGVFLDRSRDEYNQVIQRLKDAGCDAAVLGCTEIPLLVDETSPLPTLDSTRLLAEAAVEFAVGGKSTPVSAAGD